MHWLTYGCNDYPGHRGSYISERKALPKGDAHYIENCIS